MSHQLRLKWDEVYGTGTLPQGADDEVRILPEDRIHDQELRALIEQSLDMQTETQFVVHGEFELGCNRVRWYEDNT